MQLQKSGKSETKPNQTKLNQTSEKSMYKFHHIIIVLNLFYIYIYIYIYTYLYTYIYLNNVDTQCKTISKIVIN